MIHLYVELLHACILKLTGLLENIYKQIGYGMQMKLFPFYAITKSLTCSNIIWY